MSGLVGLVAQRDRAARWPALSLAAAPPHGTNLALYERCSDAWEEELLGDLMHWPTPSAEPAVLEILDAHGWGLVG